METFSKRMCPNCVDTEKYSDCKTHEDGKCTCLSTTKGYKAECPFYKNKQMDMQDEIDILNGAKVPIVTNGNLLVYEYEKHHIAEWVAEREESK